MSNWDGTPSTYALTILAALQSRPMYLGTVPAAVKAKRRLRGRAARIARRANRT